MSVAKAKHAGTHVVAHVVIPWVLRGALVLLAPVVGSVGLDIGPVAHALHITENAPAACEVPSPIHTG